MAKRSESVTVKFAQPLRIESVTPLAVQVTPPTPPAPFSNRQRLISIAVLLIFVLGIIILASHTFAERTVAPQAVHNTLAMGYTAPQNVAVGDETLLEVSVINNSSAPITVTVVLAFSQSGLPLAALNGDSTAVTIQNLPPNVLATRPLRFVLKDRPAVSQLSFTLRAIFADSSTADTPSDSINVTPYVSRVRTALLWILGGSGLIALAVNLFWDRIVKRLFT